ncbi:vitamin K-dependent protein C-like [Copidosoma floridanum]|uniref:vitamin K-dependent protein C-like n=1 Tax=Copidosoma floridanum TaxID=29053 RepID=UPI0006C9DA02|nr:vitamin K-dependent protein C-like [Copidosoma floridanum]
MARFKLLLAVLVIQGTHQQIVMFVVTNGALISKNFVVTCASCIKYLSIHEEIVAGSASVDKNDWQTIPIDSTVIHENYTKSDSRDDIALVKLLHRVIISSSVGPISLPTFDQSVDQSMNMILTKNVKSLSEIIVKYIPVSVIDTDTCKKRIKGKLHSIVREKQFCIKSVDDKDTSEISWGSIIVQENRTVLVGLTSSNGVMVTQISSYVNWIQTQMEKSTLPPQFKYTYLQI